MTKEIGAYCLFTPCLEIESRLPNAIKWYSTKAKSPKTHKAPLVREKTPLRQIQTASKVTQIRQIKHNL